ESGLQYKKTVTIGHAEASPQESRTMHRSSKDGKLLRIAQSSESGGCHAPRRLLTFPTHSCFSIARSSLLAAVLLLAAFATQDARAQALGTLRGQVTDPSAAVVTGVTVQATGNGVTRSAKTDAQGRYTLALPPGNYSV